MKNTLLLIALLVAVSTRLVAQQINFGGTRILHLSGNSNTFTGVEAGNVISTGTHNTAVGARAGRVITTATFNAFFGANTGYFTTGSYNTFLGALAGETNDSGSENSFIGTQAGYRNTVGQANTFVGGGAGAFNIQGSENVFVGRVSGSTNSAGTGNTLIGHAADVVSASLTNAAAFGYNAKVAISNAIVLGDATNTNMKVGIGTDSPQFPLDVRGIINMRGPGGKLKFSALQNRNLHHGTTDQFLTVDENGETLLARYRISIASPSQWADKVFSPAYRLRSLSAVEAYTQQHGHLPGVPSAEAVAREGADVAQLAATLLEKIEELTLYTIRLEKANRRQQVEINQLKGLVKTIKK